MLIALKNFLYMGGYAFYVWSAYGIVFFFLALQWMMPWRQWRRWSKQSAHEQHS